MERERTIDPPWLLISHGQNKEKHSFYNVANKQIHTKSIPELINKYICASTDGWLVLIDCTDGEVCLWNPESMEKIELPALPYGCDYNKCVLSKPPTDPDCHILFIFQNSFYYAFCKVGDYEYVVKEVETEEGVATGIVLEAVVNFNGQIYCLTNNRGKNEIVTLHFANKILEVRPIMKEEDGEQRPWEIHYELRNYSWMGGLDSYLMVSPSNKNQLILVHKTYSPIYKLVGFDFTIHRLDLSEMECEEVESLDESTIFIGHHSKAVCSRFTKGIRPNSIYYTDPKGRNLHIFDLEDKGRTLLLPCPSARRSQSMSYWIEQVVSHTLTDG